MEIFEKFIKAYNLARGYNDAEQAELAVELLRQARANKERWVNAYRIVPNAAPCDKIKLKNFLNPYTQDVRSWTADDIFQDYQLRLACGIPIVTSQFFFTYSDNRKMIKAYADYLRSAMPQPEPISGVYMMFQRDMKYGHCVKIGSSSDCAARQNEYITYNPFAIKGPMKAASNPREMEKKYHNILSEYFHTVDVSREWFTVDYIIYKKLKDEGFGFFEEYFKDE